MEIEIIAAVSVVFAWLRSFFIDDNDDGVLAAPIIFTIGVMILLIINKTI